MKAIKIAALAIFATATMSAQDLKMNEIPSNLMEIFKKSFTNVTDVEWEMDGEYYNVEFEVNRIEHEIWYDKNGTIIKTEKDVTEKDLPEAISSVLKSNYSEYKIDSIEMTEFKGKITYEVELEKGWSDELKVIFDASGTVLSSRND